MSIINRALHDAIVDYIKDQTGKNISLASNDIIIHDERILFFVVEDLMLYRINLVKGTISRKIFVDGFNRVPRIKDINIDNPKLLLLIKLIEEHKRNLANKK